MQQISKEDLFSRIKNHNPPKQIQLIFDDMHHDEYKWIPERQRYRRLPDLDEPLSLVNVIYANEVYFTDEHSKYITSLELIKYLTEPYKIKISTIIITSLRSMTIHKFSRLRGTINQFEDDRFKPLTVFDITAQDSKISIIYEEINQINNKGEY